MWFSYRNSREYRDGAGVVPHRLTPPRPTASTGRGKPIRKAWQPTGSGWNSATMSYPAVIEADGRKIMFHNGDGFGASGIGCAIPGRRMTILVFPSALEAAARFAGEARQWGRRVVGASSLEVDPNAQAFDAWGRLPFIGAPDFFDALAVLVAREGVSELYTPHARPFMSWSRNCRAGCPASR